EPNDDRARRNSMATRLVLVSMVAALGVSLPSRWDCERALGAAQAWAGAQLADWDSRRLRADVTWAVGDAPIPMPLEVLAIVPPPVEPAPQGPAAAAQAGSLGSTTLKDLDREAAGRECPAATERPERRAPVVFEPIAVEDDSNAGIAEPLNRIAYGTT